MRNVMRYFLLGRGVRGQLGMCPDSEQFIGFHDMIYLHEIYTAFTVPQFL